MVHARNREDRADACSVGTAGSPLNKTLTGDLERVKKNPRFKAPAEAADHGRPMSDEQGIELCLIRSDPIQSLG